MRLWRIFHSNYAICTMPDMGGGAAEWRYRHKGYVSSANHLMLIEPGEIHVTTRALHVSRGGSFWALFLNPDLIAEFAGSVGLGPQPHIAVPSTAQPELFDAFARFHRAQETGISLLERQSLLIRCVTLMFSRFCEKAPLLECVSASAGLWRAHDYLHEHYLEDVSLDRLAAIAGLSRFHFLRAFEREFMLPPHAYQTTLRVEHARLLLCAGVPAHAIEAGFSDQSHLIRQFKRAWGVTPSQYAAMVGARGRSHVLIDRNAPWQNCNITTTSAAGTVSNHNSVLPVVAP